MPHSGNPATLIALTVSRPGGLRRVFRPLTAAVIGVCLLAAGAGSGRSEIRGDAARSLGTTINTVLDGSCNSGICEVGGGTRAGRNLFHRLQELRTDGAIQGVRIQSNSADHVIIGVSGPLGALITKPVGLTNQGHLTLLSPRGIVVGNGAQFLNVQQLQLSTATSLRLGSTGVFDAVRTTANEASLLSGEAGALGEGFLTDPAALAALTPSLTRNGDLVLSGGLLVVDQSLLPDSLLLDAQAGNVLVQDFRLALPGTLLIRGDAGVGVVDVQTPNGAAPALPGIVAGRIEMQAAQLRIENSVIRSEGALALLGRFPQSYVPTQATAGPSAAVGVIGSRLTAGNGLQVEGDASARLVGSGVSPGVFLTNSTLRAEAGELRVLGYGAAGVAGVADAFGNPGLAVDGARLEATGGRVVLFGEGGQTLGSQPDANPFSPKNNVGVLMVRGTSILASDAFRIGGIGGAAGQGDANGGVLIAGSELTSSGPSTSIIAGQATSGGDLNYGVAIGPSTDLAARISAAGDLTVVGSGPADASGNRNYGVYLGPQAELRSANLLVNGLGGGGTNFNTGVQLDGANLASNGALTLTGRSLGDGLFNNGVNVFDSILTATTAIVITGSAGSGSQQAGVVISGSEVVGAGPTEVAVTGSGGPVVDVVINRTDIRDVNGLETVGTTLLNEVLINGVLLNGVYANGYSYAPAMADMEALASFTSSPVLASVGSTADAKPTPSAWVALAGLPILAGVGPASTTDLLATLDLVSPLPEPSTMVGPQVQDMFTQGEEQAGDRTAEGLGLRRSTDSRGQRRTSLSFPVLQRFLSSVNDHYQGQKVVVERLP